jgi:HSP20 family protein
LVGRQEEDMWNMKNRDSNDLFWGPWSDFRRIRSELDRLMDGRSGHPPVNVWTSDQGAVVTMELPGVDPSGMAFEIEGRTLTLRGERKAEPVAEGGSVRRRQRLTGEFARTVELPFAVDADQVEAHYARGIFEIRVPRAVADRPRKIEIQVA